MARPYVFTTDTHLFNIATGERRLFPAGETDPGDAWSEKEGGEAPGANTVASSLKDLIAAQDQIEALQAAAAASAAALDHIGKERDDAVKANDDLLQAKLAAEGERDAAMQAAREANEARDEAIRAQDGLKARVTELETDVANANQRATDAQALAESYAKDAQDAKDALGAASTPKAKKGADSEPDPAA